ncbi:protein kinase domain-containing protein [Amycolatopsis benzoatilytica]|uniref:protein kinase domain-containing protein n=1 Tax=Amycolatopsis benzoatilytica TaxID=346045 RepID=UPI0003A03B66|nr:protein kinase [Amycolatopsis benzoatilytica]
MGDTWSVPGFTEVDELGVGGFGRVVLAKHEESGRMAAIKYLRAEYLADARIADAFRREAWLLSGVRSPHVVRLFDYVETPHGAALIMEAVPGVSLRALLTVEKTLAPEAALAILKGSLLGLADAHAVGVVHRDYKPGNVLVSREGDSKLVDFGLATLDGHNGLSAGSPSYMAPEQWSGQPGQPATDVYAATCVFYQCVTGQLPFQAETADDLRAMHVGAPVSLDAVPEAVRPLITRGMAKDAAWRPATAGAFVTELETVARAAYGKDWEKRGWKRLGTAAAALTALTPLALLTTAGTAAAPVGAGAVAAGGVPAAGAGTGVTTVIVGKVVGALVLVGALVAGGVAIFGNGKEDPPPPAPVTVAMQTLAGKDPALPITYSLQYPQLSGGADPAVRDRVNAALRAPVDKRLKQIHDEVANPDILQRFKDDHETAGARTASRVLLQTPTVLSVRYDNDLDSTILGHATWRFPETVNVDLVTGRVLEWKDMFRPDVLTAAGMQTLTQRLTPHTRSGFCTWAVSGQENRLATIDAADIPFAKNPHQPAADIGFTPSGAEFEMLWYDMGCATASDKETVSIPHAELDDLLLPQFVSRLGKAAPAASSSAAPASPSSSAPVSDQGTYTNDRFGFSVAVPPGYGKSPYTPPDGDGVTFSNAGLDASLTVWGTNTAGGPPDALSAAVAEVEASGGHVTFQKVEGEHYSLSGYEADGKIFYERGYRAAGSTNALRWVYPKEQKDALDALVEQSLASFRPGDVSKPH